MKLKYKYEDLWVRANFITLKYMRILNAIFDYTNFKNVYQKCNYITPYFQC